jgi:hypothetical protein
MTRQTNTQNPLVLQPEIVTLLVRERLGDGLSRLADEGGHR